MWPIWVRDAATGRVSAARANVPDGERRDGSPEPEPADRVAASPAATRWLRERRPLAAGHPADEAGTERRQRPGRSQTPANQRERSIFSRTTLRDGNHCRAARAEAPRK